MNPDDATITPEAIAPFLGRGSLFPPRRHPFYVVAPPYVRTSAGVKALHLLCHHLNAVGQPAYLVIYPATYMKDRINLDWNTPLLTPDIADHHYKNGLTPLVIYPETVQGNPLNAPVIMRYVLNYPGLLGGSASYDSAEIVFGYSKRLAEAVGRRERVLFIPVSDTGVFYPPPPGTKRTGTCFWAAKYKEYHGAKLMPVTQSSVEITRDKPDSPTPEEIAELFRRSELFYTYENTALAIEAVLCGCPTVFLPNPHLTECIGLEELGWDGFAWGAEPAEIARAKATVNNSTANYTRLVDQFWHQLLFMANTCYPRLPATPYVQPLKHELLDAKAHGQHLLAVVLHYWRAHGTRNLWSKLRKMQQRDGTLMLLRRITALIFYCIKEGMRRTLRAVSFPS